MLTRLAAVLATAGLAWPAFAAPSDDLLDALGAPRIVEIMRAEGLDYGTEMASDFLPGGDNPAWQETVARIYDAERMLATVRAGFAERLDDTPTDELLAFFEGDTGQRIVALEISAREAMLDADVEEAARAAFRQLDGSDDPHLADIEDFVEANDLIEANVVGALNASYMFYKGLAEGGALQTSEADMLRDVWAQEDDTRVDTREWLYAFLLLAYGPLEEETVERYVALAQTPEGQAMNRALFAGFNQMYDDISYALGLAAARQMQGQDL